MYMANLYEKARVSSTLRFCPFLCRAIVEGLFFDIWQIQSPARAPCETDMTRKRFGTPGYLVNTKGHSVLKRYSYGGMAPPTSMDDMYYETYRPRYGLHYDTSGEENEIRRSVNRELILSNHLVDDSYDLAAKSRSRDQSLLREANNAIPPSNSKPAHRIPGAGRMSASSTPRRFLSGSMYNRSSTVQPLGSLTNADWSTSSTSDTYKDYRNTESYQPRTVPRESPIRSPSLSPYQTPRESPDRDLGQRYQSWRRRRPRVPVSSARETIGNYYKRLMHKRADRPYRASSVGSSFYDTSSRQSSDVESLYSDDDEDDNDKYLNYPIPAPKVIDTYDLSYDDDDDDTYSVGSRNSYSYTTRERSPSPVEYMAYQPRRAISLESDDIEDRYKTKIPDMPDFSALTNTLKNSLSTRSSSSVSDDINFYNIVAQTAAKARRALSSVNLDEYESASLVLSVEGEYNDPVRGKPLGFQYIARPLTLKGPMLAGPASYAARSTDNVFGSYLSDLTDFRQNIRQRLESGYQALRDATRYPRYQYTPVRSIGYGDHSSSLSNVRKRLEEGGDCLSVYPLQGSSSRALTASDAFTGHPDVMDLYESGKDLRLSTLDKIKIKVNSEIHVTPKAAVASRRARSTVPWSYNLQPKIPSQPQPYVRREAALVGSKVDVVIPKRHGPRSEYGVKAMRRIEKESRAKESLSPESTVTVKSRPVRAASTGRIPTKKVDAGLESPNKNILSWQHRLQSRVPPEDLITYPKAYTDVRTMLRDVQGKMDRHKQLMDRYLETDLKPDTESVQSKIMNLYVDMESRNPSLFRRDGGAAATSESDVHYSSKVSVREPSVIRPAPRSQSVPPPSTMSKNEYKPMSDVRRRVRRVINKNRMDYK